MILGASTTHKCIPRLRGSGEDRGSLERSFLSLLVLTDNTATYGACLELRQLFLLTLSCHVIYHMTKTDRQKGILALTLQQRCAETEVLILNAVLFLTAGWSGGQSILSQSALEMCMNSQLEISKQIPPIRGRRFTRGTGSKHQQVFTRAPGEELCQHPWWHSKQSCSLRLQIYVLLRGLLEQLLAPGTSDGKDAAITPVGEETDKWSDSPVCPPQHRAWGLCSFCAFFIWALGTTI